jgi:hypothetical protein
VQNIYKALIHMLNKEISFYKDIEEAYLNDVITASPDAFPVGKPDREDVKKYFIAQYNTTLANKKTKIGKLESAKIKSLGATRWPKKSTFRLLEEENSKPGATRFRKEAEKDLENSISIILKIIEGKGNTASLGEYKVKNSDKYIPGSKDLKIKDKEFKDAVEKIIERVQKRIKDGKAARLAGKIKMGTKDGVEEVGITIEDVQEIQQLLEDLSIHSYYGKVAERLTPAFINSVASVLLGSKLGGDAELASEAYKDYNIIDTKITKIKIKDRPEVTVGLSQKYTKRPIIRRTYKVDQDIYQIVDSYSELKSSGATSIKKDAKFLLYIRKNLVTLNQ